MVLLRMEFGVLSRGKVGPTELVSEYLRFGKANEVHNKKIVIVYCYMYMYAIAAHTLQCVLYVSHNLYRCTCNNISSNFGILQFTLL